MLKKMIIKNTNLTMVEPLQLVKNIFSLQDILQTDSMKNSINLILKCFVFLMLKINLE